MKSSELWNKLPTAGELLENPRVRSVVDRLNPSVVTARVRGFLDEVRGELSHRAEDAGLPSVAELVERVSRYLTGADAYRVGSAINATGRFRGGPWVSTPLAESAVERMLLVSQDFAASRDPSNADLDGDARLKLCELTGAEAAALFNSHASSIALALQSVPMPKRVIVARGEVTSIDPSVRLTDLASGAGIQLSEVGDADRVTIDDYLASLSGNAPILSRPIRPLARQEEADARPCLKELILAAKGRGAEVIVELDGGALRDIEGVDTRGCPSVQAAIEWGAQLVLVRGDGLIGGPACGIVLGNAEAVARLLNRPIASAHRIDAARAAALAATLELHGDPGRARLAIPTLALATTPVENLRSRAERLAPQIEASAMVAEVTAVELPAGSPSGLPCQAASWGICLRPAEMNVERLAEKLLSRNPAIRGIVKKDELLLDLRTVFPRQDLGLVAAFGTEEPVSSTEDPVAAPAE